jgi:integrative and conjugative element protein (TIGR02256 family)
MPFMSSWATSDQRILLNLADSVIAVFEEHIQHQAVDSEAGGLLLGTVHGASIAVTEATVPTLWDKRFRYLFERLSFGHSSIAQARWNASGGTVRYVGEWHTHPQDYPTPSGIDRTEWNKLSKKRADGRPMLAVIVGRKNLYVELVPHSGIGSAMAQAR